MLATLNDFLMPIFLFVIYFCAVSVLLYPSKRPHLRIEEKSDAKTLINLDIKDSSLTAQLSNTGHSPHIFYAQTDQLINKLNKRQSRRICKSLGIQQKCDKVEKPLTLIKAEVYSLFKEDPERVIAVIQEKLPELIFMANQPPYIDEKIAS